MACTDSRLRGLDDLRWHSLTRPERLLVAGLLERAGEVPALAHLDNVAFELRASTPPGACVPLVLTSLQNRAVAATLEGAAEDLERGSQRFAGTPAIARSAHYGAGLLRSLVDRLVRGAPADPEAARERVLQLLLLDAPEGTGPGRVRALLDAALRRLHALGLGDSFAPVLEAHADEAATRAPAPAAPAEDASFEFEIVDVTAERMLLAQRAFGAALNTLGRDEAWKDFVAALGTGRVAGCEAAPEHPEVAQRAASKAFTLASSIRRHLAEMSDAPWDAVSPGLKAILDTHPALKQQPSLKDFVRAEVRRSFEGRPGAAPTP